MASAAWANGSRTFSGAFLVAEWLRRRCEYWMSNRTTCLSRDLACLVRLSAHSCSASSLRSFAFCSGLRALSCSGPSALAAWVCTISAASRQLRDSKVGPGGSLAQAPGWVELVVEVATVLVVESSVVLVEGVV